MMSSGNEYSGSGEEEATAPADPGAGNESSTESEKPMETSGPDSTDVQGEAAAENAKETGGYGY